jgi:hypothetical protein
MPNGSLGGNLGTHSQVIIIPKPFTSNTYFIITTQRQDLPSNRKLQYHEVDMTLNGGLGDVVLKNVELYSNNTTEQVAATYHNNGSDLWVVTHEYGSNKYLAFLVTSAGISTVPVVSTIGSSHIPCWSNSNARGNIKFSPDGSKIVFNANGENGFDDSNILEILDFDNSTGMISNPIKLPFYGNEYGLTFSPDNNILYCTTWVTGSVTPADSNFLYQFDISSNDSTLIADSRTLLHGGYCLDNQFGTMNIGPDGKIYVAKHDHEYLGVINAPNTSGTACEYIDTGLYLNGATSNFGLNNTIEYQNYCSTLYIQNNSSIANLQISPNPTSSVIRVEYDKTIDGVTIYTLNGEVCFSNQGSIDTVDISLLQSGVYIILIDTNQGQYRERLIKM